MTLGLHLGQAAEGRGLKLEVFRACTGGGIGKSRTETGLGGFLRLLADRTVSLTRTVIGLGTGWLGPTARWSGTWSRTGTALRLKLGVFMRLTGRTVTRPGTGTETAGRAADTGIAIRAAGGNGTKTGSLPGGPALAGESVEVGLKLGVFLRLLAYRVGL